MDTRDSTIEPAIEENSLLKAEIARLKQFELYYQAILNQINDAVIAIDEEGRIRYINGNAERICGWSQEEALGRPLKEIMVFADGHQPESINSNTDGELEAAITLYSADYTRLILRDGHEVTVSIHARPLRESTEEVTGALLIIKKPAEENHTPFAMDTKNANMDMFPSENPSPVLRIADNGNILYANKPAERVLDAWETAVDRPAPPRWQQIVTEALQQDQVRLEEDTIGDRRISFSISPAREAHYVNLYAQDITERGLAEESALEQEKRFRLTFEQAAVGIAHVGLDGRWLRVNEKLCEIVGYTREELLTISFQDITHTDDLEKDLQFVNQVLAGEIQNYAMEKRYIRKDGSPVWINLTVALARNASEEPDYFISVVENITGKIARREELKQNAQELALRNQIAEVFLTCRQDDTYAKILNIMLEVFASGFGVFGFINRKGDLVVPTMTRTVWDRCQMPDKRFVFARETWGDSTWVKALLEKRTVCDNQPSTRIPEGHIPITRNVAVPLIHQREVVGLLQVANKSSDYTEEDIRLLETIAGTIAPILDARLHNEWERLAKEDAEGETEAALVKLRRSNKELEQFAYVASHDLQEPLRQISSYVQLLADRYSDHLDEKGRRWVGYTIEGVTRMKRLINDLLTYSRIQSKGKALNRISADVALDVALQNLASSIEESQTQIEYGTLPEVWGDTGQITQLFQNLIGNAIKFKHKDLSPHIQINAQQVTEGIDAGRWVFSVADNGIGIEPQHFERIFTIFQRLHAREDYPGNGIGLALCTGIVQRHDGKIWVESTSGSGSTFYFSLKGVEHES